MRIAGYAPRIFLARMPLKMSVNEGRNHLEGSCKTSFGASFPKSQQSSKADGGILGDFQGQVGGRRRLPISWWRSLIEWHCGKKCRSSLKKVLSSPGVMEWLFPTEAPFLKQRQSSDGRYLELGLVGNLKGPAFEHMSSFSQFLCLASRVSFQTGKCQLPAILQGFSLQESRSRCHL